jgi:kynurenine aminotransferase
LSSQYDNLVFDGKDHIRIANFPGMWERTVTVGSAGSMSHRDLYHFFSTYMYAETFAATGWRVGWLIGPASIVGPTLAASTRIVFCSNSPMQEAAAAGLEQAAERKYYQSLVKDYQERRAILTTAFDKLGLKYTNPEGSYFVLLVSCSIF